MKTTEENFNFFKKCCQKWINQFELNNWDIDYSHNPNKNAISSLRANLSSYIATINLSTTWDTTPLDEANLNMLAKHEVIHLLMARSMSFAKSRYITSDEIEEAEEELTNKLVNII
ncbi:MAG TPA: hypothetical protein ENI23_16170 [bacterium]|nr:hypothetical protein [bacterium]